MSLVRVTFPEFPDLVLSNMNFGEGFWLADLLNWFDGTDARAFNDARPDADGDFDQNPVYSGARFPIVQGRAAFASEQALFDARKTVAALWGTRGPVTLQVESPEGVQSMQVVRNGKPSWDLRDAPALVSFELPFKAADPRKYGPLQSASTGLPVAGGGVVSPVISPFTEIGGGNPGRVVMTNLGTTDTFPVFMVTGGLSSGVELIWVETGDRLRLEWPLTTANVAVFDTATGQVWLDNQSPISGYLTVAQWRALGPGETGTIQFVGLGTPSGTPMLTVEWRDADA